jgi:hypothetical protein
MLRVSAQSEAKLLNRYITHTTVVKFDDSIPDHKWDNNRPVIKSKKNRYHVEWDNVKEDAKGIIQNPFEFAPQIAYSLAAFWFILLGQHENARLMAFGGAIAFGSKNSPDVTPVTGATAVISATIDCTGSNGVLIGVAVEAGNGVSSFTYAGAALTVGVSTNGTNDYGGHLYYKIAPATGSNTLTYTNAANFGVNYAYLVGIFFTGADQATQLDGTNTGTSASGVTSGSVVVTTGSNNSIVVGLLATNGGSGATITAGQTQVYGGNGNNFYPSTQSCNVQYHQNVTAGADTLTWSWSGAGVYDSWGIAVKEAAAGPSVSPSLSPSLSPSVSPSLSPSQSPSLSPSISPSVSLSPSISPSFSPSQSPSSSISPSSSLSPPVSPSVSPSPSPQTWTYEDENLES